LNAFVLFPNNPIQIHSLRFVIFTKRNPLRGSYGLNRRGFANRVQAAHARTYYVRSREGTSSDTRRRESTSSDARRREWIPQLDLEL
jgi:hypothetical protein